MMIDVIDNIVNGYIAPSKLHGQGLFAIKSFGHGELVGSLDGQVLPWRYIEDSSENSEWNALNVDTVLFRPFKTKYFFINHSRFPNLAIKYSEKEGLVIYSLREIAAGEELLLDYRLEPLPLWYVNGHGATYL